MLLILLLCCVLAHAQTGTHGFNSTIITNTTFFNFTNNTDSIGDLNPVNVTYINLTSMYAINETTVEQEETKQMTNYIIAGGGILICLIVIITIILIQKTRNKKQKKNDEVTMLPDEREKQFKDLMLEIEGESK